MKSRSLGCTRRIGVLLPVDQCCPWDAPSRLKSQPQRFLTMHHWLSDKIFLLFLTLSCFFLAQTKLSGRSLLTSQYSR